MMEDPFTNMAHPGGKYHKKSYDRLAATKDAFEGHGKTVLITGGATGIGFATAKAFAESGTSRIVIVSRSKEPQLEAKAALEKDSAGIEVVLYQHSLTDFAGITAMIQELKTIDILVHSAATSHDNHADPQKADSIDLTEMKNIFDGNVLATYNLAKAFLALPAPASNRRAIINISSVAAQMTIPNCIGYGASKAAGVMLFRYLAAERPDVKMFSIHPGAHFTPMSAKAGFKIDMFPWDDIELPAYFCRWLATPEADFLHGRMLWAHWDVDGLVQMKERVLADPNLLTQGLITG